jgi:isoleucyl-tRNA synthetase
MEEVDRYILARYAELARKVVQAYDEYQYPTVFQALNGFATVDLSAFYADVSKDRLYTFAARSRERRSAQTAMFLMADGLTRLLAPILPVTADELWQYLPGTREESVHMAVYPATADLERLLDTPLLERWSDRLALRERVLAEIEPLRKSKQIGSSLQARVILTASGARYEALARDLADLPMLFIVSEVELKKADAAPAEPAADPAIAIARAGGVKCERCWRYVPRVSEAPGSEGLCERCQEALAETVEP